MSRLSWEIVTLANLTESDAPLVVENSELREAIGLRHVLWPGYNCTLPAKLGMRIDDCLVEFISYQLWYVESGAISVEYFKWLVRWIEERVEEDAALRVFEAILEKFKGPPLASKTFLKLVKRKVLHTGRSRPSFDEGRQLADVLLAEYARKENVEMDWIPEIYIRLAVDTYMDNRDPHKLLGRVADSEWSPTEWEVLIQICNEFAARGEDPVEEVLKWSFGANHGSLKRPDGRPAPRNRPRKMGYMYRDNEIRHTVRLLSHVGMPKQDAHEVVGEVVSLTPSRIQQICGEPSWSILDIKELALKSLDASSYHRRKGPSAA